MIPGEYVHPEGVIALNPGRERVSVRVVNTADRPVQVGSHYHFAAANPGLEFDRKAAWGMRLDVAGGDGDQVRARRRTGRVAGAAGGEPGGAGAAPGVGGAAR